MDNSVDTRLMSYTYRPSGAKGRIESPVTDTSAIVGAREPRPTGWGTQPLRIQSRVFCLSYLCVLSVFAVNNPPVSRRSSIERIHLDPPKDTDKHPTPTDQILSEQQPQEKGQRLPIEPNTADLQHGRLNRPTHKYGKP